MKKLVLKPEEVKISTEFIKLDSFLKLCRASASGGEAKMMIQNGNVEVNGEICTQRGKKLYHGDIIKINNTTYKVEKQ